MLNHVVVDKTSAWLGLWVSRPTIFFLSSRKDSSLRCRKIAKTHHFSSSWAAWVVLILQRVSWFKFILALMLLLLLRLESWRPWMHEYLSWQLPILHMDVIIQRNLQNKTFSFQRHCCQDLMYYGWSRINQTGTMTSGEKNVFMFVLMIMCHVHYCTSLAFYYKILVLCCKCGINCSLHMKGVWEGGWLGFFFFS